LIFVADIQTSNNITTGYLWWFPGLKPTDLLSASPSGEYGSPIDGSYRVIGLL